MEMTLPRRASDEDMADAVALLRAHEEFEGGMYPSFITKHIGRMKAGSGLLPSYLAIVPNAAVSPAVALCRSMFPASTGPMGLLKYHYFRFIHKPVLSIRQLAQTITLPAIVERVESKIGKEYVQRMCTYPPLSVAHQALDGAKLLSSTHVAKIAILLFYKATKHLAATPLVAAQEVKDKFSNSTRTLSTGTKVEGIEEFTGHVVASCAVSLGGLSRLLIAASDGKCAEIVGTKVRTQFQLQPVDTYISKMEMTGPTELSWWAPHQNSVNLAADPKTNELLFS